MHAFAAQDNSRPNTCMHANTWLTSSSLVFRRSVMSNGHKSKLLSKQTNCPLFVAAAKSNKLGSIFSTYT